MNKDQMSDIQKYEVSFNNVLKDVKSGTKKEFVMKDFDFDYDAMVFAKLKLLELGYKSRMKIIFGATKTGSLTVM
jgi:hypothetical protein